MMEKYITKLYELGYNKGELDELCGGVSKENKQLLCNIIHLAGFNATAEKEVKDMFDMVNQQPIARLLGYDAEKIKEINKYLVVSDAVMRANLWLIRALKLMNTIMTAAEDILKCTFEFEPTGDAHSAMLKINNDSCPISNENIGMLDNFKNNLERFKELYPKYKQQCSTCLQKQQCGTCPQKQQCIACLQNMVDIANDITSRLESYYPNNDKAVSDFTEWFTKNLPLSEALFVLRGEKLCDAELDYYLFDNTMAEIIFGGTGFEFIWKYKSPDEADIFRASGTNRFSTDCSLNGKDNDYYKSMIIACIEHMNKGESKNNKLASWSKNPCRDIYKYLIIEKENNVEYTCHMKLENDKPKIVFAKNGAEDDPYTKKTTEFCIVKKAKINYIREIFPEKNTNKPDFIINDTKFMMKEAPYDEYNFFEFRNGIEGTENYNKDEEKNYAFCIDILNNVADNPRNAGDVRNVFKNYTGYGLQLNIVAPSDEEVIMLGATCDGTVNLDNRKKELNKLTEEELNKLTYNSCKSNFEYRCELGIKELIVLYGCINIIRHKALNIDEILKSDDEILRSIDEILDSDDVHINDLWLCKKNCDSYYRYLEECIKFVPEKSDTYYSKYFSGDNYYKKRIPLDEACDALKDEYAAIRKEVIKNCEQKKKLQFILEFVIRKWETNKSDGVEYKPEQWDPMLSLWHKALL